MKLSWSQREALKLLNGRCIPQTAQQLGAKPKTLRILRNFGCVEVELRTDGAYWHITERGRQEAGG